MIQDNEPTPGPSSPPSPPTPRAASKSVASESDAMADFTFTCRCTNITITSKVSKSGQERMDRVESSKNGEQAHSELLKVRVDSRGEHIVSDAYLPDHSRQSHER